MIVLESDARQGPNVRTIVRYLPLEESEYYYSLIHSYLYIYIYIYIYDHIQITIHMVKWYSIIVYLRRLRLRPEVFFGPPVDPCLTVHTSFLDLEKAFDRVPHHLIFVRPLG